MAGWSGWEGRRAVSAEATRRVIGGFLGTLLDRGDVARYLAPNAVWTTMESGQSVRGRDAVGDHILALHHQIFDAHPQLDSLWVTDDIACLEAVFVGTHIGEFAGIASTGTQVHVPYCILYTVADGLISELRAYVPLAALINQLAESAAEQAATTRSSHQEAGGPHRRPSDPATRYQLFDEASRVPNWGGTR